MKRLDGKVALISGTASGLGRATAVRFAREGALVVGGDLDHAGALDTMRLIAREGGTALVPCRLDGITEVSVRAWVSEAVDAFGAIDILCANADAVRFGPVATRPHPDFSTTVRAELDSVWLSAQAAWQHLTAARGCIVALGPTAGLGISMTNQHTAHAAAEGGVIALTRQLAAEGPPHGLRANCISPRLIDTEESRAHLAAADHPIRSIDRHIPLGRCGTSDDVTNAAVFLASDEASCITGSHLVVDGGRSAVPPGHAP
ncbi:SDR family NAD(P)-dependent oxidoreductase [Streptomyces sp. t39]|uniref:SDR family NAD(P)-dependent oxidoreductase n=1 Tax=Streptomyces sp. t39 TaxID=1828156 RepID=UPI0011CDE0F1|nr:SDR family oxidoreductase [Streptomyces sp. t39]TXS48147.1 SDR family oxidoreductase [Streptomyces sp. t39]